jgi:geranylgeranyl diphosphate synthase type I
VHDELRASVDAELHRFLADRRAELVETAPLIDEIVRLLNAGGKRLRPAFCYWGYRAVGARHEETIVKAAASLELLHTFAVVHDDIMDQADERRGHPTVHALHGVDIAILVGDLCLVLADAAFMSSGFEADLLANAFVVYSRMRQEVIGGQYLDLKAAEEKAVDEARARRIAALKSGGYSIEKPLLIGATLGRGRAGVLEGLAGFGAPLGEAFQLRDDLLGIFGSYPVVGKSVDSDIRQGKHHLLYAKTVASLEGADRSWFLQNWGRDGLSESEIERLRGLVDSSGARVATEELLEDLRGRAMQALDELAIEDDARVALTDLALRATERVV